MEGLCFARRARLLPGQVPVAVGALCARADLEALEEGLRLLDCWAFAPTRDLVALDRKLAGLLRDACPPRTLAAAASIGAWETGPVTGGVVGAPHGEARSAPDEPEELCPGLWCWSRPGGPGFALQGDAGDCWDAREAVVRAPALGEDPWEAFSRWAGAREIPAYLYVSDGSGQRGRLAGRGRNLESACLLDEVKRMGVVQ